MKTDTKALSSFSSGGNLVNGSQLSEPIGQSRGPGSAEAAGGRVCTVLADGTGTTTETQTRSPVSTLLANGVCVGAQWKPLLTLKRKNLQ